jgi:hypothetical protein
MEALNRRRANALMCVLIVPKGYSRRALFTSDGGP